MPSDFGLIAMALVFISFSRVIQDFGIGAAVIQKKNIDDLYLNTAFISQIILGLVLALSLILGRHYIASFYEAPILSTILFILAIGLFVRALFIIQRALLIKDSDFKSIAILTVIAISLSGIVALIMAYLEYGYWSLVSMHIIETLLLFCGFWYFSKWRPKFEFSERKFNEIFNYSAPLFGTHSLTYWTGNIDRLLIGKEYGESNLGLYSRANNLVLSPVNSISRAISTPFFPLMSKSKSNREINKMYQKGTDILLFIFIPLMISIGFYSNEIVLMLLGEKWQESGFFLKIFSFLGVTLSLRSLNSIVFKALGNTKTFFKVSMATKIISIVIVLLSVKLGLKGIAYAVVFTNVISDLTFVIVISKILEQKSLGLKNKLKIISGGSFMVLYFFLARNIFGEIGENYLVMFSHILIGALIYLSTLALLKEKSIIKVLSQAKSKL